MEEERDPSRGKGDGHMENSKKENGWKSDEGQRGRGDRGREIEEGGEVVRLV